MFSFSTVNSFMFLFLENYGVRKLEAVFAVLISTMALSFAWMFADTKPSGKELMLGEKILLFWLWILLVTFRKGHDCSFCG